MSDPAKRCPVCDGPMEPLTTDGPIGYIVGWLCLESNARVVFRSEPYEHYEHFIENRI